MDMKGSFQTYQNLSIYSISIGGLLLLYENPRLKENRKITFLLGPGLFSRASY